MLHNHPCDFLDDHVTESLESVPHALGPRDDARECVRETAVQCVRHPGADGCHALAGRAKRFDRIVPARDDGVAHRNRVSLKSPDEVRRHLLHFGFLGGDFLRECVGQPVFVQEVFPVLFDGSLDGPEIHPDECLWRNRLLFEPPLGLICQ